MYLQVLHSLSLDVKYAEMDGSSDSVMNRSSDVGDVE